MRRRNFIKAASIASIASAVPFHQNAAFNYSAPQEIIKPKRLKKGDTIGLIAPAGFITEKNLNESVDSLSGLGFNVVYKKGILDKHGYLAGTDERRASEVNEMFERKDVSAIICARGGYGCARILPMLDYELIKNNPKILMGYSDITAMLYALYEKCGLVSFHGPVGISTFNEYGNKYLSDLLFYPSETLTFFNADEDRSEREYELYSINTGKGIGRLIGGNLSIMVSMIDTPYDVDYDGKIIFIEEVGEEPYRIDRMLTQMKQAGKFDRAKGIAIGVFKESSRQRDSGIENSFTIKEVLFDILSGLNIPVVYGMSFGHITNKFTVPFGIKAELDSLSQTLTLLEAAVI